MTRRRIYDAHHHLWDLSALRYPWLEAKGVRRFFGDPTPIQRSYLVADLRRDANEFDLAGSTHVQVGAALEDAVAETEWLDATAARDGFPSAIVAFTDLTAPDVETALDDHMQSSPLLKGVRQIVGRHPNEDAASGAPALLADPAFKRGLRALSRRGLSFDLQLTQEHYAAAADVFSGLDELDVAICHFGSPWDLTADGFARWRSAIQRFAQLPRMRMKFSGFGMFMPDWKKDDVAPFVGAALQAFGPDRCMAGSNFPVDKLYGSYDRIWRALEDILGSGCDLDAVTLQTGRTFYRGVA